MRAMFVSLMSLALALSACSTPPAPVSPPAAAAPVPGYITAARSCAVVVGGSVGSSFNDIKVARVWHEVNRQITDFLYDDLSRDKYRVARLTVPVEESGNVASLVTAALASNQCNRVIQVSHAIGEDAKGKYFLFDVSVMHVEPKGDRPVAASGTSVVTVGDYKRAYRYPRTMEFLDAFHTDAFADQVYADLKRSAALEALK